MMFILLSVFGVLLLIWMGWQFLLILSRFVVDITEGGILGGVVKFIYLNLFFMASLLTVTMLIGISYAAFVLPQGSYDLSFWDMLLVLPLMYALPMHFLRFVQATLSLVRGRFDETLPAQLLAYERSIVGTIARVLKPSFKPEARTPSARNKRTFKPEARTPSARKRKVEELPPKAKRAPAHLLDAWEADDEDTPTLGELLSHHAKRQ